MTASMTGYGRSSAASALGTVTVEIKTVNSRYLELNFRTDGVSPAMEELVRQAVKRSVARGKAAITVKFIPGEEGQHASVTVNEALLAAQIEAVRRAQRRAGVKAQKLTPSDLLALPAPWLRAVCDPVSDEEVAPLVEKAAEEALTGLLAMRRWEGENLAGDLSRRISALAARLPFLREKQEAVIAQYETRLRHRIQTLLSDAGASADESRILEEVAVYAEKTDYTEELVRFESHLKQFDEALRTDEPVGRRLDFLLQEINREINTMASKAGDLSVVDCVIQMKTELEKIREQVQNLE